MRKFKVFVNFDKEEKWLMTMAQKGYRLENTTFGYKFRRATPEQVTIRIDTRRFNSKQDFVDYCTLFEDSGWKHLAGDKRSSAQYFQKIEGSSDEDIFSDGQSKAERYQRLSLLWLKLSIIPFVVLMVMSVLHYIDLSAIVHPRRLYLTPGLWEKSGQHFWNAFWFETPFVAFRAVLLLTIPVQILLYLVFAQKANRLYKLTSGNDNSTRY